MTDMRENTIVRRVVSLLGLAILTSGFAWSIIHVARVSFFDSHNELSLAGQTEITFAHWQLEGRNLEALQWAADEYMKLHPDVYVRQIGIPTTAYDQWVRTQLIGRTAPDLIEMWTRDEWDSLAVRYFQPVSDIVEQPNPYNIGTDLATLPWRDTYRDGMIAGFRANLQEFYAVPLSMFTVRIYANRDLIDEAATYLGKPSPGEPQTLNEFFELCEDVREYSRRSGNEVVPIAGGESIAGQFGLKYLFMGFAGLTDMLDHDLDCAINYGDILEAVYSGQLDFVTNPNVRSGFMALYDICRYFPDGFMSSTRDMPISLFVQGKAAMIATGSWEAGSIFLQAGDLFDVVVFDFPVAAPDHPEYGQYLSQRVSEARAESGFSFGLTRFSRNREIAIDFLHFLSSQGMNEQLNLRMKWFPAIKGTRTDDVLAAFQHRKEGVYNPFTLQSFHPGPKTSLSYRQRLPVFVEQSPPTFEAWSTESARIDSASARGEYENYVSQWKLQHYKEFMSGYQDEYLRVATKDFQTVLERTYRNIYTTEANIAAIRIKAFQASYNASGPDDSRADTTGQADAIDKHMRTLIHGQTMRSLIRQYDRRSLRRVEAMLNSNTEAGK